jgi:hypothetical protein
MLLRRHLELNLEAQLGFEPKVLVLRDVDGFDVVCREQPLRDALRELLGLVGALASRLAERVGRRARAGIPVPVTAMRILEDGNGPRASVYLEIGGSWRRVADIPAGTWQTDRQPVVDIPASAFLRSPTAFGIRDG